MKPSFFRSYYNSPKNTSIIEKISKALEQAEINGGISGFYEPDIPLEWVSSDSSLLSKGCIRLDEALASGNFQNEGLGVFTCKTNKSIWRIEKDASGNQVLVRDEEFDAEQKIVDKILNGK